VDRRAENLAASLGRAERQKRVLEEWTGTLERTVTAHERVSRDREARRLVDEACHVAELESVEACRVAELELVEACRVAELKSAEAGHVAELRVRAQEMAAVEKRLTRTLESQSFRIGHLLVRVVVAPVKGVRWVLRLLRRLLVRIYRLAQRVLPDRVVEPLQQVATLGQVATARRHEVLDLSGDRPVAFVDCRGLTGVARDEAWARVAASDQPARTVVLTDDVDFTGLRALGLSFEYLPPYRPGTPWWADEADHDRWVDDRLTAARLGYGVD
jgi:hypothetical protein